MAGRLFQMSGVMVDHVYRVAAVPLAGVEANVRSARLTPGGGFNAMVAARRAGMSVAFAGTLGTGPLATMVAQALRAEEITHLGGRRQSADQGSCTVLVDDCGERTFIALPGADGIVTDADLLAVQPEEEDWILQSGYALSYPQSHEALARWLERRPPGACVVFDPGPKVSAIPAQCLRAAMKAALWVSANAAEAFALTDVADPAEAACALSADRPAGGGAVVRIGADGAWLSQAGQAARHLPGHKVHAIDTNGAGDAHIGYFIAMLAAGHDPAEALELANIAAALSTTKEGPSTAPSLDRVRAHHAAAPGPLHRQGTTP